MYDLPNRTPAVRLARAAIAFLLPLAALGAVSCSSGGGGGTGGVIPPAPPGVTPDIVSIQNNIFTPKCALSGCHTGPTPQPLQGAGLDLTLGASLDSLLGAARTGVPSTLDAAFSRVEQGNSVDSYLYMKIIGDARVLGVALNPGVCSMTTETTCAVDGDCLPGETCSLLAEQMPRNGPELTAQEKSAIAQWIDGRVPGNPGPPGY